VLGAVLDRLVHPDARRDRRMAEAHLRFIAARLLLVCLACAILPIVLLVKGGLSLFCLALVGSVALLLVPATAGLNGRLGLTGSVAGLALALATLSAIAKAIGISRWLFAMPGLAQAYVAPGADQATVALLYETLNAYAGGIGEVLGVGLVSGVWTLLFGMVLLRSPGVIAKGLGAFLLISGLSLFLTIPASFGVELGPVLTISGFGWQFSLLGLGLWCLTRPRLD
jgi:hypothetical protein